MALRRFCCLGGKANGGRDGKYHPRRQVPPSKLPLRAAQKGEVSMKTNKRNNILTRLAAMLLAIVLFAGMAVPTYAADSDVPADSAAAADGDSGTKTILITTSDEKEIRELLKDTGMSEEHIQQIIDLAKNADLSVPIEITIGALPALKELPDDYTTSEDAEKVSETHIRADWAELDWSTANDGYVRIKWTKKIVNHAVCYVYWVEDGELKRIQYKLNENNNFDRWTNIPLTAGNKTYAVSVEMLYSEKDLSEDKTDEELDAIWRDSLVARFTAI